MKLMNRPAIQNMLRSYGQLSANDRNAVKALMVFFVLLILYGLVWLPANKFYDQSILDHDKQISLLQYMRATENKARSASRQSGKSVSGQSLLQSVSSSAQKFNLKPNRLQPEGSDGVSVWLNEVSFKNLINWLDSLDQQGYTVRQISIDRGDKSGMVNARIVLGS